MEKTENLLEINNLVVRYGGIEAVRGISFGVPKGKIVTLIGSNGAGKSSTLRSVVGLVKPAAGSITFKGEDLLKLPTETIVTRGITSSDGCLHAQGQHRQGPGARLYTVPEAEGAFLAACRNAFGRRAADACHRESPDEQTGAGYDGRAVTGARADHRPGGV